MFELQSILEINYSAPIGNVTQGHLVIEFKFAVAKHIKEKISGEKQLSYHTAPIRVFEAITREIDNIDWKSKFESLDCNESFNYFSKICHSLCNKYMREAKQF